MKKQIFKRKEETQAPLTRILTSCFHTRRFCSVKRSWNPKLLQYVSTPFFFVVVAGNKAGDYSSLFSVCYWLELLECIFYGTTIPLSSNMSRAPLKGKIALHQVPIIMSGCAVEVRCWNSKFLNSFLSIMSDGHIRMFDVRIFTQTKQWVMQRKTFFFFAKLPRYVTCLCYGVSKGQHEPGSALWPCHFKNKNTSASTTAEVTLHYVGKWS